MSNSKQSTLSNEFFNLDYALMQDPTTITAENAAKVKKTIIETYKIYGFDGQPHLMNWGISNFRVLRELNRLVSIEKYYTPLQDPYSLQLVYYMVRKLIKSNIDLAKLTIVDIGCGNGYALNLITDIFSPKKAIGIDLCHQQIQHAKNFYGHKTNIEFLVGDAESLPLEKNTADLVISLESSHCYPSPTSFFNEVHRVLKPNGYFSYADLTLYTEKNLPFYIEQCIQHHSKLSVIVRENLSSKVLKSIIGRVVKNETILLNYSQNLCNQNINQSMQHAAICALLYGAILIPPHKLKIKNPQFKQELINLCDGCRPPPKDFYMYYLLKKGKKRFWSI